MVSCRVCKTSFEAGSYRDELCPGCGALVPVSMRLCPCCSVPLERRDSGGLTFDECARCGGVFLDHQTQQRVFGDKARADVLVAALSHGAEVCKPSSWRASIPCPACTNRMTHEQSDSPWVVVDVCHAHGTFYDAGELPCLLEVARQNAERKRQRETPAPIAREPAPANSDRMDSIATAVFAVAFLLLECCRAYYG